MPTGTPPTSDFRRIETLDLHAAGEPLRIVVDGLPPIPGADMLAKRRHARAHLDGLRRFLIGEPRGHSDMYGAFVTAPVEPDGDYGVLFVHNAGFSTMCGHGILALASAAATCGFPRVADVRRQRIDTPAGRVVAGALATADGGVRAHFDNVLAFAVALDRWVDDPELGRVPYDLAFGGAYYAFVEAAAVGLELAPSQSPRIVAAGERLRRAIAQRHRLQHPSGADDLDFLYGTIFTGPAGHGAHSRHACVFAESELDRSPTGTGVSARAALLAARGALPVGREVAIESLLGESFGVEIRACETIAIAQPLEQSVEVAAGSGPSARQTRVDALHTRVSGRAFVTGRHVFSADALDPLAGGFFLSRGD